MSTSALPRILIADPIRDQRQLYADYFRWSGFLVDMAATGGEALEKCRYALPDVVSACYDLPEMDAPTLCRILHEQGATAAVPVIVLATRASTSEIRRALSAGCTEILLKPVLPEQLLMEVRKHVRRSRLVGAVSQQLKLRAAKARVRANEAVERGETIIEKLRRERKR